jgi:predicted hotdog family 3-hydroxylacyl-ACP dehydratase
MPVAIEELLPHRTPMRWIDELVQFTETTAKSIACFSCDHFAVANGAVLETALVECVAQTVAAAQSARARTSGKSGPPAGGSSGSGMLASRRLARANEACRAAHSASSGMSVEITMALSRRTSACG